MLDQASSVSTAPMPPMDAPAFKLYKPVTHQTERISLEDIPDSYFTPTAADLKDAQATLSARTQALLNAPLQLRAQREAAEKSKHDRWPNTTIRIRFTDRTQLEKSFLSTDKIRSVYAFVRSLLRDDIKHIKFILYQSPPKRDFKVSDPTVRDLSLSQLQLSPSSVLLLRFEDESLNRSDIPVPLMPSIMAEAVDLLSPPGSGNGIPQDSSPSEPKQTGSSQSGEKKIPKWLRMGLKK